MTPLLSPVLVLPATLPAPPDKLLPLVPCSDDEAAQPLGPAAVEDLPQFML